MQKIKSSLFVCLLLYISTISCAQYKVTFEVKQRLLLHSMDQIYIAGNFDSWNAEDKNYQLTSDKTGISKITFQLLRGTYEYKFTRGSWEKVETDSIGKHMANRSFPLKSDTTIEVTIMGWNDDFNLNPISTKKIIPHL